MNQQNLQSINIHRLLEKCRSKKELYKFLQQDSKAYLPKIGSVNVYFFRQILKGQKEYIKREDVKISSIPHIEGLTVQDFLNYARQSYELLKFLLEERDWVHLDRQWICDVLYSIDTENIQNMINNAIERRQQKFEQNKNMTIQIKPEFVQALEHCIQFSINVDDKGRSVFLLKDSSRRKRTRQEIQEVQNEEHFFKENKQDFLREHKRLRTERQSLEEHLIEAQHSQDILKQLIEVGIINESGEISIQQQFNI